MPGDPQHAHIQTEEMSAVLGRLAKESEPMSDRVIDLSAEAIVSEAQVEAPVDTGHLKSRHVVIEAARRARAVIGALASYALAVHERHPTKAFWFLEAITRKGPTIIRRILEDELDKAGRRASR